MILLNKKSYLTILLASSLLLSNIYQNEINHTTIDKGLDHYIVYSTYNKQKVHIFKINPNFYDFKLLSKSNLEKNNLSMDSWVDKYNLTGAINAGMFQKDNSTNVGYMKNFSHINNSGKKSNYKSVLAFNRKRANIEEIKLFDLTCDNWDDILDNYETAVQNYRTISCKNQYDLWKDNTMEKPISLLASDKLGNIYFIFTSFNTSVSSLNKLLIGLDFDINRTMYLEGGSQASITINVNNFKFSKSGAIFNDFLSPIPNVIGFSRKNNH